MDTRGRGSHEVDQGVDLERGDDTGGDDDVDEAGLPPLAPVSTARSAIYRSSTVSKWGWSIDLDRSLNPFVPASPLPRLPPLLARFLGYRTTPPQPLGNLIICLWGFISIFAGVAVVEVVGSKVPAFRVDGQVPIMGSFGASAVLQFYAIESPLAQPRNAVLGKVVSTFVGISMSKLFQLAGSDTFERIRWVAGALSTALATVLMGLTGTVHPPAGAAALIAVTDDKIRAMGWNLMGHVVLGAVLMQLIALLFNNIQRQFPLYWWTPEETGAFWARRKPRQRPRPRRRRRKQKKSKKRTEDQTGNEEEKIAQKPQQQKQGQPTGDMPRQKPGRAALAKPDGGSTTTAGDDSSRSPSIDASAGRLSRNIPNSIILSPTRLDHEEDRSDHSGEEDEEADDDDDKRKVIITRWAVVVPESMFLRPDERLLLETLTRRL